MADRTDRKYMGGLGGPPGKPALRRRVFLIKHRFQLLFAFYPLLFFALFLLAGGVYLYDFIDETLSYYLYLPHCRADNIWPEISPAVLNVGLFGGAGFACVLGLWVWRKYARMRNDIAALEKWGQTFDPADANQLTGSLKEREVRALAHKLADAAERYADWEERIGARKEDFLKEAETLLAAPDDEFMAGVAVMRDKWLILWDEINHVRVDEGLT